MTGGSKREGKGSSQPSDKIGVIDTAEPVENQLNAPPPRKRSILGVFFTCGAVFVTLTMLCSVWIYFEDAPGPGNVDQANPLLAAPGVTAASPTILGRGKDWIRQQSPAFVIGRIGAAALLLMMTLWWCTRASENARRLQDENLKLASTTETLQADLASQTKERQRLEREVAQAAADVERKVEERTSRLAATHAQLEKELNSRRQAERLMTQQTKELERSKDVLGLHVQARTQELQKLQSQYESILNSAGEGIYGVDLKGRTTFVNPATARITGWKVEELIGKSESEVFHRLGSPEQGSDGGTNGQRADHHLFYRRDGSSFPAEYTRTPIREKDREIGAVVIFKDITERKRAEEALNRKAAELSRSNAELEQFAYVASHDLQEPLRKIQAFGDRLKTKCDAVNLQEGRDYLERMQSAAARMQTLINDLLTFSRVISASQPFVPVDLNAIAKGVLGDLEVRIEQTKAKVEVGELPTIEADPMQMRQLLQNLIGNALKFQPPEARPVIRIHARILKSPFAGTPEEDPLAEQCELTIQDNGIGFDEKYLDKIFAVFQRLHGRNEYEGTGVGLAVCRRITDRHEGIINAKSKPGEGAAFIITLPVHHTVQKEIAA